MGGARSSRFSQDGENKSPIYPALDKPFTNLAPLVKDPLDLPREPAKTDSPQVSRRSHLGHPARPASVSCLLQLERSQFL